MNGRQASRRWLQLWRATTAGVVSEIPIRVGDRSVLDGTRPCACLAELDSMTRSSGAAQMTFGAASCQAAPSGMCLLCPARGRRAGSSHINPFPTRHDPFVEVEFDNPTRLLVAGSAGRG